MEIYSDDIDLAVSVSAARVAIDALRYNCAIAVEENRVLKWVLSDVSSVSSVPFDSMPPAARAVVAGIEMGGLMVAPPTQCHRDFVVHRSNEGTCLSLSQLLEALSGFAKRDY